RSGGAGRCPAAAGALALPPTPFLRDAPCEGPAPATSPRIGEGIAAIAGLGCGILLAESNIPHVPAQASRLYVIERGQIIYGGAPGDASRDPAVLRAIGGAIAPPA